MPLTPTMLDVLRAVALTGSYKDAAQRTERTLPSVRHLVGRAHVRLDVTTTIDAFRTLGWLVVP